MNEGFDVEGFRFWVSSVDGFRTIEGRYPPRIDVSRLSTVITCYYDLWDGDVPTITITDVSPLESFSVQVRAVLKSVIQRTVCQESFVASAWIYGDNVAVGRDVVALLREIGREGSSVFATREEAVAYVREQIEQWKARPSPDRPAWGDD